MTAIEPRMLHLREIEARLAFAECHLQDQRALVARLTRLGLDNSVAHALLRSMEDSMAILRLRQRDILAGLDSGETAPPTTAPDRWPDSGHRGR